MRRYLTKESESTMVP